MTFGQMTYEQLDIWPVTRVMLFFKYHAENEAGTLVPDQFLFLKNFYKK